RAGRLRERFASEDVTVVRADIETLRWPGRPFQVVASPPYNVTTLLVRRLLSMPRLRGADLVLQKAAARRLAADPPGRLAADFVVGLGMPVPRRAFHPPPRV